MKKTDIEVRDQVLNEIEWDIRLQPTEIGVAVKNSTVTLTGTVDSWVKKVAAKEAAYRVAGVLDVVDDVRVRPLMAPGLTDVEVAANVRKALEWDVLVPHEKIRTLVSSGIVTLEGEVPYAIQRSDAERSIRNLTGVMGIINNVKVKEEVASTEVQKAIKSALERRALREANSVRVDVAEGRVTVSGHVDSWPERQEVLRAIRGTRGVRTVVDNLTFT